MTPDEPIRFKRGVEHLLRALPVPLVPVVHDAGRYWRRDGKRQGTIVVRILPALDGNAPPALLARRAEAAMNAARLEAAGESRAFIETAIEAGAPRGARATGRTPKP
jgi:1-acyl-sn-glycerol-3-phosphate acyltransferase